MPKTLLALSSNFKLKWCDTDRNFFCNFCSQTKMEVGGPHIFILLIYAFPFERFTSKVIIFHCLFVVENPVTVLFYAFCHEILGGRNIIFVYAKNFMDCQMEPLLAIYVAQATAKPLPLVFDNSYGLFAYF